MNDDAEVVDAYLVDFDHVGQEFECQQQRVGDGHAADEERGVSVAHALLGHHQKGEHVANGADDEQDEQAPLAQVPLAIL